MRKNVGPRVGTSAVVKETKCRCTPALLSSRLLISGFALVAGSRKVQCVVVLVPLAVGGAVSSSSGRRRALLSSHRSSDDEAQRRLLRGDSFGSILAIDLTV